MQLAHSNQRSAFWSGDLPQQILDGTLTHLDDYECACRAPASYSVGRRDASSAVTAFMVSIVAYIFYFSLIFVKDISRYMKSVGSYERSEYLNFDGI